MNVIDWLMHGLKKPGKTQRGLALALGGKDPAAVNRMLKGKRKLNISELPLAARYLGEPIPPQLTGLDENANSIASREDSSAPSLLGRAEFLTSSKNLPILGRVTERDQFLINEKDIGGYTMRPTSLDGISDAYAIIMPDDTMGRAYRAGDQIYVNPRRPTKPGDDVVVIKKDKTAIVRQLLERTETHLVLIQERPEKKTRLSREDVRAVHFIVGVNREGV